MENKNIIGTNFIITNRDLINEFGINAALMLWGTIRKKKLF